MDSEGLCSLYCRRSSQSVGVRHLREELTRRPPGPGWPTPHWLHLQILQ